MKAFVKLLIYQDGAGYAAATASLAALEASVKAAFPSKPPQSVADIVALYQHASTIKHAFDQVGVGLAGLIFTALLIQYYHVLTFKSCVTCSLLLRASR